MQPESSYMRSIPIFLRSRFKLYGFQFRGVHWGLIQAFCQGVKWEHLCTLDWRLRKRMAQLFFLPSLLVCLNPPSLSLLIYFQSSRETSWQDRFLYHSWKFFASEARNASPMLSWNWWSWPKHTPANNQIAKMFPCPAQPEITREQIYSGGNSFEFQ